MLLVTERGFSTRSIHQRRVASLSIPSHACWRSRCGLQIRGPLGSAEMRALSSSPPLCRRRREETHSLSLSLPSPTDGSSQSLVTSSPTDGSATGLDQSLGTHATCLDIRGRCGLKIRALTGRLGPSNNCSEMRPHLGMRMLLWCCKRRVSSITGDVGRADASAKRTEFSDGMCRYFHWSRLRPRIATSKPSPVL